MAFDVLEGHVRIEHRVAIVEPGDQPERDDIVGQRVHEGAAELLGLQRVAHRVDDPPRRGPARRHLPQLFDPDGIHLRAASLVETKLAHERFRQVAAHAVGEDRHLGADVDAGREGRFLLPVLVDAPIAGADADDGVTLEEHLGRGKTGEHVDAFRFDQAAQPLDELDQRDDVVAVVLEERRGDRQPELRGARQKIDVVARSLARQRRPLGLEVGDEVLERGRIEQRAGQHVRARLARLFQNGDGQRLAPLLFLELREPERGRHPGGPAADDQHVDFEGLALGHYLFSSAIIAGTISNRSPTIP